MENALKNIQESAMQFIKAYDFNTPLDTIIGDGIKRIQIFYKADYFNESSEHYKRGIGSIILIFKSDYRIIIKQTISGSWCFALLDKPYNVIEEVWHLSAELESSIPQLRTALESGFLYRNYCGNLMFDAY